MYAVLVKKSVTKSLGHIPAHDIARIDQLILSLATNPRPRQSKQLHPQPKTYRVRQGDYRILYVVDDERREVTIFRVQHRRDVYR